MNNSLQNKNSAVPLCIAHASFLHNNMCNYVNCNFKQVCELRYGNVIKVNKKIKRESGKNWRWKEALGFNNKTRVERCPLHRLFPLEGCRNIPLQANKTDNPAETADSLEENADEETTNLDDSTDLQEAFFANVINQLHATPMAKTFPT